MNVASLNVTRAFCISYCSFYVTASTVQSGLLLFNNYLLLLSSFARQTRLHSVLLGFVPSQCVCMGVWRYPWTYSKLDEQALMLGLLAVSRHASAPSPHTWSSEASKPDSHGPKSPSKAHVLGCAGEKRPHATPSLCIFSGTVSRGTWSCISQMYLPSTTIREQRGEWGTNTPHSSMLTRNRLPTLVVAKSSNCHHANTAKGMDALPWPSSSLAWCIQLDGVHARRGEFVMHSAYHIASKRIPTRFSSLRNY